MHFYNLAESIRFSCCRRVGRSLRRVLLLLLPVLLVLASFFPSMETLLQRHERSPP